MGQKAVAAEVSAARKTPASLAVDEKLQDNVKLASSIETREEHSQMAEKHSDIAHAKHTMHKAVGVRGQEDTARLQLAMQILKKEHMHKLAAAKPQAKPQTMKERIQAELDRKTDNKLRAMEEGKDIASHDGHKKSAKLSASEIIVRSMTQKLNDKVHASEVSLYHKEMSDRIKAHPDLGVSMSSSPDEKTQKLSASSMFAKHSAALPAHSIEHDITLADSSHLSNMQLEYALRAELNGKVQARLHSKVLQPAQTKSILELANAHRGPATITRSANTVVHTNKPASAIRDAQGSASAMTNVQLEHAFRRQLDSKVQLMQREQGKQMRQNPSMHEAAHASTQKMPSGMQVRAISPLNQFIFPAIFLPRFFRGYLQVSSACSC